MMALYAHHFFPQTSLLIINLLMPDVRYNGDCLLKAIDSLPPAHRDVSRPLRLPICDVIASHTLGQVAVCGKVESGGIQTGSKVPF